MYTAWGPGGRGFDLDDPAIGLPVIQHAHDLGVNVVCAHKGLPLVNFESTWNQPRDMVAVSRQFPDMQFVVFHAGWTPQPRRGALQPGEPGRHRLPDQGARPLQVPPNSNVWVDLGTVWRSLLTDPTQAAHVLSASCSRGSATTGCCGAPTAFWYGSPQTQIMAFRAFEISAEFQERYGYPALTDAVKAEGPRPERGPSCSGLDPHATRCALASDTLSRNRSLARALADTGELPPPWVPRGPVTRGQLLHWLARQPGPWIPA